MMHLYRWQKPSLSAFSWCIIVLVGDGCLYLVLLWKMHFFLHPSLFLTADIREVWQWQRWIKQLRKAIYHPKWFSCELVGMKWPCEKAFFISCCEHKIQSSSKRKKMMIAQSRKSPRKLSHVLNGGNNPCYIVQLKLCTQAIGDFKIRPLFSHAVLVKDKTLIYWKFLA